MTLVETYNRNPNQWRFIIICVIVLISSLSLVIMYRNVEFSTGSQTFSKVLIPKDQIYLLQKLEQRNRGWLVETPHCKIPDFNPWPPDVISLYKQLKPFNCLEKNLNWSYVENSHLVINTKQMKKDGHLFSNRSCCYKIIRRVAFDPKNYKNMDTSVITSACIPIIRTRTEIRDEEFISVECINRTSSMKMSKSNNTLNTTTYKGFHTNVMGNRELNVKNKIKSQQTKKHVNKPNILVLGLDSTSRLNFQRHMYKTMNIIKELGAVEMLGFTKVGENTFPNLVPALTGYSETDLHKICYPPNRTKSLDACPFIWKRFNDANYLTGYAEDFPKLGAFNYYKYGFTKQPVDFYLRPFFVATSYKNYRVDCIGSSTNDEVMLSYVESQLDFANKRKTPIISFSWSTSVTHDDFNVLQLIDTVYADYLLRFKEKGYLDNTIMFIMGDHGYRYGQIRRKLIGNYENKLPAMWIYLPPSIRKLYPEWQESLEWNAMQLTSPFMIYATLNKILNTFTTTKQESDAVYVETGKKLPRKYFPHFFERDAKDRNCSELGIPWDSCACSELKSVSIMDRNKLEDRVKNTIKYINGRLPKVCAESSLSKILYTYKETVTKSNNNKYIVAYVTVPGNFEIEAEIDLSSNENFNTTKNIHRINSIKHSQTKCVKDPFFELYCFCKQKSQLPKKLNENVRLSGNL